MLPFSSGLKSVAQEPLLANF